MSRQSYALEEIANIPIKSSKFPDGRPGLVDALICGDGFQMSVQASEYHLCEPKTNVGPWVDFEVRAQVSAESDGQLKHYLLEEDKEERTYSNVPLDVLRKVIDIHGGLIIDGVVYTYVESGVNLAVLARNFMVLPSEGLFLSIQDGIRNSNHKDKKCNLTPCRNCSYFREFAKEYPIKLGKRALCPITLTSHPDLFKKGTLEELKGAMQELLFTIAKPPKELPEEK
jgi:hypothetical protein